MKKFALCFLIFICLLGGCSSEKEFDDNQQKLIKFATDYISNVEYSHNNDDWTFTEYDGVMAARTFVNKDGNKIRIRCDWTISDNKLHFVEIDKKIKFDDGYLD